MVTKTHKGSWRLFCWSFVLLMIAKVKNLLNLLCRYLMKGIL